MTGKELKDAGWSFQRILYCCGGQKNEIYKKGRYELRVRPIKQLFILREGGNSLTQFLPLDKLKQKLDELEVLEKATNR